MANQEQLEILMQGVETWNKWREENPNAKINLEAAYLRNANLKGVNFWNANLIKANLLEANLMGANLSYASLNESLLSKASLYKAICSYADFNGSHLAWTFLGNADFSRANLSDAILSQADLAESNLREAKLNRAFLDSADIRFSDLSGADLSQAFLSGANLSRANFNGANLSGANLNGVDFNGANLTGANLSNATLNKANFVGTKVSDANISNGKIYGVNVWDLEGEFKEQNQLVITPNDSSVITVDNIKVAQFVYLILNNKEIRDVLNTLTSKAVLILGRFGIPERKAILDALRNKLRDYDLLPIVFDFERAVDKDFTETVKTLAGMCYFVIADITNPKSSPMELQATVPDYQIPFVPIIQAGEDPFSMMANLQTKYTWVLDTISYDSAEQLIKILKKGIIDRAMKKHDELRLLKVSVPTVISGSQFEEDE